MDPDFNWVTARHGCSLASMFVRLRQQADQDVRTRQAQLGAASDTRFELISNSDRMFSVIRHDDPSFVAVDFSIDANLIKIERKSPAFTKHLGVSLCDDGVCRFTFKDEAIAHEPWQITRLALEPLMFR